MPTEYQRSAAEYLKRAQRLRIAAKVAERDDTRRQLLLSAQDYERFATRLIKRQTASADN